ncbi:hypothetical protein GGR14_001575 [Butyricimonas faecihominis]|uniref:Uncharacterized protein n=1 Tax=Butyricimonas faecihominis TaxID=1472416 RepID=A0A7W6MYC5_9BACT|nr:hypothetical protein [Butyricimonas faecihominis]OKZ19995.1 MAG: hypothetical protein BHV81_04330 [Butyricimonas synergistica]
MRSEVFYRAIVMRKGEIKKISLWGDNFVLVSSFLPCRMVLDKMKKLGNILQKSRGYYIGLRQDSSC